MTCGPFDKLFRSARRSDLACAALAAAAALVGCASSGAAVAQTAPGAPAVDQTSPAGPPAAELPRTLGPFPKWSQFPRGPQPVPPPSQIASSVADLQSAQANLLGSASRLQWTLSGTEGFAAAGRAQINPEYAAPAPEEERAEAEAYAKALREQATPPPAPK
jgi:hypothetical protein